MIGRKKTASLSGRRGDRYLPREPNLNFYGYQSLKGCADTTNGVDPRRERACVLIVRVQTGLVLDKLDR